MTVLDQSHSVPLVSRTIPCEPYDQMLWRDNSTFYSTIIDFCNARVERMGYLKVERVFCA